MKNVIVINSEDDREAIEAAIQSLKSAAWKDIVKAVVLPKWSEDDVSKAAIRLTKSRALSLLGAALAVLDIRWSSNNVSNNPEMDEQFAKGIEDLTTILSYKEPIVIDWMDNKSLYDNTPWYAKFMKGRKPENNWWDKTKFKKKGRIKSWFIHNCNNADIQ